jgi:hypothetical protein
MEGMVAVAELNRIRQRKRLGPARGYIEKALTRVAERTGLSLEEIEELVVPTFDLGGVGILRETLGDCAVELAITGTRACEMRWFNAKGKQQKSVPTEVKRAFPDDLKRIRKTGKDVVKALSAQRQRIEGLLRSERDWLLDDWKSRYLDQPLLANMTRRLLWTVTIDKRSTLTAWPEGEPVDVLADGPLQLAEAARVRLWHPIHSDVETVQAARQRLDKYQITQPFKQAHREIYVLTEAEMETRSYSNRFAAHIVKQGQLNALCQDRGWSFGQMLIYDPTYGHSPRLKLPAWDLEAEFFVQPAEIDMDNLSEIGAYPFLQTDQVRFTRLTGGRVDLVDVPEIVFSEVMRDVDLFVAVASIGNDPSWQDRGEDGEFQGYWETFSFGDLSASAKTRREVLERLLPRLKLSSRCSLTDRFLVVRGDIRTYKIHLGSSNIRMEPNDEYLCIVPDSRSGMLGERSLFLPFEGDTTLAVILSKAFMLADDTKITDTTITSQIGRGRSR